MAERIFFPKSLYKLAKKNSIHPELEGAIQYDPSNYQSPPKSRSPPRYVPDVEPTLDELYNMMNPTKYVNLSEYLYAIDKYPDEYTKKLSELNKTTRNSYKKHSPVWAPEKSSMQYKNFMGVSSPRPTAARPPRLPKKKGGFKSRKKSKRLKKSKLKKKSKKKSKLKK